MRFLCYRDPRSIVKGYLRYADDMDVPDYFRDRSEHDAATAVEEYACELGYELQFAIPREIVARGFSVNKFDTDDYGLMCIDCDDDTYMEIIRQIEDIKNTALIKSDTKLRKKYLKLDLLNQGVNIKLLNDFKTNCAEKIGRDFSTRRSYGHYEFCLERTSIVGDHADITFGIDDFKSYEALMNTLERYVNDFNPAFYWNTTQRSIVEPDTVLEMIRDLRDETKVALKAYQSPVKTI